MRPWICRCCGLPIVERAADNPNLCVECIALDCSSLALEAGQGSFWASAAGGAAKDGTPHFPELEHLLTLEEPTVLECLNAEEQAKRAIRELAMKEAKHLPYVKHVPHAAKFGPA